MQGYPRDKDLHCPCFTQRKVSDRDAIIGQDLFNIGVELLFQRLIVSIISSPDEDSYMSIKDSQSLVNVISLLAHHLEPDGPQVHVATSK